MLKYIENSSISFYFPVYEWLLNIIQTNVIRGLRNFVTKSQLDHLQE